MTEAGETQVFRTPFTKASLPFRTVWLNHVLSLGGKGAGTGFHSHSENWLGMVHGQKKFYVAEPNAEIPHSDHPNHSEPATGSRASRARAPPHRTTALTFGVHQ